MPKYFLLQMVRLSFGKDESVQILGSGIPTVPRSAYFFLLTVIIIIMDQYGSLLLLSIVGFVYRSVLSRSTKAARCTLQLKMKSAECDRLTDILHVYLE